MVADAPRSNGRPALLPASKPDDRSGHGHRQLIGVSGIFLPLFLYVSAGLRPLDELPAWVPLTSISAYYYTGGVAIFCGVLVALALLLVTYQGYDNDLWWLDRLVAVGAGVAAFLVAFYPTGAPPAVSPPPWWTEGARLIHYRAAVGLLGAFVIFAWILFPHTDPAARRTTLLDRLKEPRNAIYYVSGAAILVCMIWAYRAGQREASILIPEWAALFFFGLSWLVKGRADRTLVNLAHRIRQIE